LSEEKIDEDEEIFMDAIHILEQMAEFFPHIDDYKILVTAHSMEPIIIMNIEEFNKLEKEALGYDWS